MKIKRNAGQVTITIEVAEERYKEESNPAIRRFEQEFLRDFVGMLTHILAGTLYLGAATPAALRLLSRHVGEADVELVAMVQELLNHPQPNYDNDGTPRVAG